VRFIEENLCIARVMRRGKGEKQMTSLLLNSFASKNVYIRAQKVYDMRYFGSMNVPLNVFPQRYDTFINFL